MVRLFHAPNAPRPGRLAGMNKLLTALLLMAACVGCESKGLPVLPEADDAPVRLGSARQQVAVYDTMLTDIAQHIDAVPSPAAAGPSRTRVVAWGKFTNMTGAPAQKFAEFRVDTQNRIAQLAGRHGVLMVDADSRAGVQRHELHATVIAMPDDKDQWLVQWALLGPKRDGGQGILWRDTTTADTP